MGINCCWYWPGLHNCALLVNTGKGFGGQELEALAVAEHPSQLCAGTAAADVSQGVLTEAGVGTVQF